MNSPYSRPLLFTIPIVIALSVLQEAHGMLQTLLAACAAVATTGLALFVARFAWTPLLRKIGFWFSSLFLGCAIVAVVLVAVVAGAKAGGPMSFGVKLFIQAAVTGLLLSWVLAVMAGAQDKNRRNGQSPRTSSALFRPSSARAKLHPQSR